MHKTTLRLIANAAREMMHSANIEKCPNDQGRLVLTAYVRAGYEGVYWGLDLPETQQYKLEIRVELALMGFDWKE